MAWLVSHAYAKVLKDQPPGLSREQAGTASRAKVTDSANRIGTWLGKASLL